MSFVFLVFSVVYNVFISSARCRIHERNPGDGQTSGILTPSWTVFLSSSMFFFLFFFCLTFLILNFHFVSHCPLLEHFIFSPFICQCSMFLSFSNKTNLFVFLFLICLLSFFIVSSFCGGSGSEMHAVVKMNVDTDTQWACLEVTKNFYQAKEGYLQGLKFLRGRTSPTSNVHGVHKRATRSCNQSR